MREGEQASGVVNMDSYHNMRYLIEEGRILLFQGKVAPRATCSLLTIHALYWRIMFEEYGLHHEAGEAMNGDQNEKERAYRATLRASELEQRPS